MSELSVHICESSITFARDGRPAAVLPRNSVDPEGLSKFQNQNYQLMGSVGHQQYLEGVFAGLQVAFGPPTEALVELANGADPPQSASDLDLYVDAHPHKFGPDGEFVNDSLKELQTVEASEVGTVEDVLLQPVFSEEIIVPGITVHDGVIVGTGERTPEEITTSEIPPTTAAEVPAATEAPAQP